MIKRLFAIFVFLFSNGSIAQDTTALFEQANQHYNEGAYTEAVKNYKAILATNQHSTELYFNLGNAYYKLNKVAESIYYYEKALQLQPEDPDVLHNIQFAQNMTLDAIETLPQTQLASVKQQLLQQISAFFPPIVAAAFAGLLRKPQRRRGLPQSHHHQYQGHSDYPSQTTRPACFSMA